jgi:MurNAc alpha-1-phosphate uridylyltransferase
MKAMILAAGRGERMRPLTEQTPKPLLKAGGEPLIDHVLRQCAAAGIQDVVINVFHLGQQIIDALGDGSDYGVNIEYSIEEELLGTGGGIVKALPKLGDQPFLALSGDVWSTYDLTNLIAKQQDLNLAHLVLVNNPDFHQKGDFHLDASQRVRLQGEPKLTYANLALLHPKLFAGKKVEFFGLGDSFRAASENDDVTGEHYQGSWMNVGTPAQLQQLDERLRRSA